MRQARASGRIAPFMSTIRPVRAPTPASSWAARGGGRCAAWGIAVYPVSEAILTILRISVLTSAAETALALHRPERAREFALEAQRMPSLPDGLAGDLERTLGVIGRYTGDT